MSTIWINPTRFIETWGLQVGTNSNLGRPSPGKLNFPSTSPASHCCLIPIRFWGFLTIHYNIYCVIYSKTCYVPICYGNRWFRSILSHPYSHRPPFSSPLVYAWSLTFHYLHMWAYRRKAISMHSSHIQFITDIKSPHSCSPLKHHVRSIPQKI